MTKKWTTKYGLAAVLAAVLIIAAALFASPNSVPNNVSGKSSFAVMLTDPPNVPAGTTVLNLTYSDISLHITHADGTSEWVSVGSSGTVNSFALVNMSQTIASTTIPTNSSVDKVEFTISKVVAVINGTTYNVTTLSNTLVLQVANSQINQTLSGVLVDFNPTLLQIQAVDPNGNPVNYYVLVPSATATIVNDIDQAQIRVGTIVRIGQNNRLRMAHVVQDFSQAISITSASLTVNGNSTSLSVTLQNNGGVTFRIFGVMLRGEFNLPFNQPAFQMPGNYRNGPNFNMTTVPFEINGTTLVSPFAGPPVMHPMIPENGNSNSVVGTSYDVQSMRPLLGPMQRFGLGSRIQPMNPLNELHDDRTGGAASSYVALQPGQTATLTFSGVIVFQSFPFIFENASTAITPIVGNNYTIQLTGEGFQTYTVTATA
jgi:hypothetical protein